jgi:hypothetical protein
MVNREMQTSSSPSNVLQIGHSRNDISIYPRLLSVDSRINRISLFTELPGEEHVGESSSLTKAVSANWEAAALSGALSATPPNLWPSSPIPLATSSLPLSDLRALELWARSV